MLTHLVKKRAAGIEEQDRVMINGIYVGRNYTNNKYIIQLIKPDFAKLPHETLRNDQRIEIDAKYVKPIPKRGIEEANLKPSLTDRVSMTEQPKQAKQEDNNNNNNINIDREEEEENKLLTECAIIDEWNNILGENDSRSMEIDVSETCDAWTLNDCDSCKRILFCLSYYRLWIIYKYNQHNNKNKNKNNNNNNKSVYVEYLIDFIKLLSHYSQKQMLNDFHHIKQYHIRNNNNNNNNYSNIEDKQDVFEYFKKQMGICNYSNCRSYSRNNRDRNECTESNKLRRNLYFIAENSKIKINEEITETNIQQLFDMIHCTLLHPHSMINGDSNDDKNNKKNNKFITEIDDNKEEEKDKGEEEEDDDVETRVSLSSYGFGAQFKYHQKTHKNYIKSRYKNLKNEILNNKLYQISLFDYDSLTEKAKQYLISYRGRLLIARKKSKLNQICLIKPNTPITLQHIISLMLYTNMDDLQREFKKGCRYLITDNQKIEFVKKRNQEIANWCKLLWESITFYGESINKKQVFYHGLNCKLLFNSVIAAFNCPTSTTVNKSVAFNFSTENGIIVQLGKFGSLDSHYLDVSDLSDYPNEQERLFFQAQLGFQDIIYNNTSNKYFIKCLNLFQNITKGNFFTHNTKIFKNKHQKTLIKMMDYVIDNNNNNNNNNNNIPKYMQQLFQHYCKSIKQFGNIIWINKEEFSKLNENMRKYLNADNNNDNFTKLLQTKYKIKIKYPKTLSFVVKNHDDINNNNNNNNNHDGYDDDDDDDDKNNEENLNYLDLFWDGKSVTLPQIYYHVNNNGKNKKDKKNKIILKLKLKKGATKQDNTVVIMVKIDNKILPDYVNKLKCDFGVFCPQIQFSYTTTMTISKKLQAIPLCESNKLDGLDAFEWKIFVKFRGRVDSMNLVHKL